MSRMSTALSLVATFVAGALLAACDPLTAVVPLPGVPEPVFAAEQAPSSESWACEGLLSQEVCSMTSTCLWSTGSGECIGRPQRPLKY